MITMAKLMLWMAYVCFVAWWLIPLRYLSRRPRVVVKPTRSRPVFVRVRVTTSPAIPPRPDVRSAPR